MIITISGTPGSGKSSVAKFLLEEFDAKRVYVGGIRREIARKKGMTLLELNDYALTHPETDIDVDKKAAAQAKKLEAEGHTVIVEGRVQYHFLKDSIKIYMKVSYSEAAKRIFQDLQKKESQRERNEKVPASLKEMEEDLRKRVTNDAARYRRYYNLDISDESQYDYVLDTEGISAQEASEKIAKFIREQQ